MEFAVKLTRDPVGFATVVTVEALLTDRAARRGDDKRILLGLLQRAINDAIEAWEKGTS